MARKPLPRGRIGVVDLKHLTGLNAPVIIERLSAAGIKRSTIDKSWSKADAIRVLKASKEPAKVVAARIRGKQHGVLSLEDIARITDREEIELAGNERDLAAWDAHHGKPDTFADKVARPFSALTEAKAASELERVRKLRLDNDRNEAKLVDRAKAIATAREIVARTRTAFLPLGRKLAPMLSGLSDEIEIAAIIESEIRHTLGELANVEAFSRKVVPPAPDEV